MIVVDIETTGTNPEKHAVVSIGAVELENSKNTFYTECRIWDAAHIDEEALKINGFTRNDITDTTKETQEIALRGLSEWAKPIRDRTLAGHQISFDTSFLIASFIRESLPYPFAYRTLDTHSLTYLHMIKRGITPPFDEAHHRTALNADFVFNYVGLEVIRDTHNALEDAKLTAEAISRILYDRALLDEYKQFPIPWLKGKGHI